MDFSPDPLQTVSSYTKTQPQTPELIIHLVFDLVVCPAAGDEIRWSSPAHLLLWQCSKVAIESLGLLSGCGLSSRHLRLPSWEQGKQTAMLYVCVTENVATLPMNSNKSPEWPLLLLFLVCFILSSSISGVSILRVHFQNDNNGSSETVISCLCIYFSHIYI